VAVSVGSSPRAGNRDLRKFALRRRGLGRRPGARVSDYRLGSEDSGGLRSDLWVLATTLLRYRKEPGGRLGRPWRSEEGPEAVTGRRRPQGVAEGWSGSDESGTMVVEPVSGPTGSSSLCDESSRTLFELRARAWPGMSIGASTGVRSPIPPLATVRLRLLSTCQRHQRVLTLFDKTPRLPFFSNSAEKTCNHLTRLPQLGHPKDSEPLLATKILWARPPEGVLRLRDEHRPVSVPY
jgi:hypothetical protein